MTPQRWRQVTELFHSAREREADDRRAFLDKVCAGDPSLRADVDALLAAEGTRFGETPLAIELLPQLSPGTTFGPYRVEALIGAGGMGQVYRATDTKLRRTVALKVLLSGLARDPDFESRFEQEAQLLAALNHPNIAAIYGTEDTDGVQALVLEFVDGSTLAERIARGPLPIREALPIAHKVASALEAAHEHGIIHRDLKPANIKIAPDGTAKVLDFGIARVNAGGSSTAPTAAATRTGVVVGTPAYMSPEQARGKLVDKRTDIWALGCVLYEMLTGRGAFAAETESDTLARVIEREPEWSALPTDVPESIRRLLTRCLQKDPANRLHDIADARIELDDALTAPARRAAAAPTSGRGRWLWAAVIALATMGVATAWWALHRAAGSSGTPGLVRQFGIVFPDNHIPGFGVAVSPDGRFIAAGIFSTGAQLYLHSLETSETRLLAGTQRGTFPFWSADGSKLGFVTAGGQIRIISIRDGSISEVCPVQGFNGATWGAQDNIVFASARKLLRVAAAGGTPVPLSAAIDDGVPRAPQFLPDGRHFIVYLSKGASGLVLAGSIDSSSVTTVMEATAPAVFVPPNHLLFIRGTTLWAQDFDPERRVLNGHAAVVATKVSAGTAGGQQAFLSASSDVLAFGTTLGGSTGRLRWVEHDVTMGEIAPPDDGEEYLNPALSPDGKRVAVNHLDPNTGNWDVWVIDVDRGPTRLTTNSARDADPVWSPDGEHVVFMSDRDPPGLYEKRVGSSDPETLVQSLPDAVVVPGDWSPSPLAIFFSRFGRSTPGPWSVWMQPLSGGSAPVKLIDPQFAPYSPRLSPDGRWLAYTSFETGSDEIFVRSFPASGKVEQISHGGGAHPRWTKNGHELVYWVPPRGIDAVDFVSDGSTFHVSAPRTIVHTPVLEAIDGRPHYDITRDGTRVLMRQAAGPQGPGITVIVNWAERMK